MDNADVSLPGNVFGRKNPHDTRYFFGSRAIDPADVRPGMVTEFQGGVQHSIKVQVIDKCAGSNRFVVSVIFGLFGPHPAGIGQFDFPLVPKALGRQFDGIDDFHITRAAAKVKPERVNDLFPVWPGMRLQKDFGSRQKSRCAKSALDSAFGHKCPAKRPAQAFRETLNGNDVGAVDLFHADDTGKRRLGIHLKKTGAAACFSAAAVFNRYNPLNFP